MADDRSAATGLRPGQQDLDGARRRGAIGQWEIIPWRIDLASWRRSTASRRLSQRVGTTSPRRPSIGDGRRTANLASTRPSTIRLMVG